MTTNMQDAISTVDGKRNEILTIARSMYETCDDWVIYFRDILGFGGAIQTAFPTHEKLAEFEQTDEYQEIQEMLAQLRQRGCNGTQEPEETKVITVRLPKSIHEYLRKEAYQQHTSMNKLCISKLLQRIDGKLVPTDGASKD